MYPSDLPDSLVPSFTVREAAEAGVARSRLRAHDLRAPFHGTRATRQLDPMAHLGLLMRVLPSQAFACGTTAALVFGMPLPYAVARDALEQPMIAVPHSHNRIRRKAVRGRALRVDDDEIREVRGIRTTSALRTWRDLSPLLDLPAFVAVTDFLISHRATLCSVAELRSEHAAHARRPGADVRRRGLDLCSTRAESPRESELRTVLALAGLPIPECNVEIFDGARFVARVDLLYPDQKLVVEYYGDYHRDPRQWSRDQSRRAELESLGYRVTVVSREDFRDLPKLAARIRRLLEG